LHDDKVIEEEKVLPTLDIDTLGLDEEEENLSTE
jgi:hypothetical protein